MREQGREEGSGEGEAEREKRRGRSGEGEAEREKRRRISGEEEAEKKEAEEGEAEGRSRKRMLMRERARPYIHIPNPPHRLPALDELPERDSLRSLVLLAGLPKNTPWLYDSVSTTTTREVENGRKGRLTTRNSGLRVDRLP